MIKGFVYISLGCVPFDVLGLLSWMFEQVMYT